MVVKMFKEAMWMRTRHTRGYRDQVAWPCIIIEYLPDRDLRKARSRIVYLMDLDATELSYATVPRYRLLPIHPGDRDHLMLKNTRERAAHLRKAVRA